MERRREFRINVDEVAEVTVLGTGCSTRFRARLVDLTGRGIRLTVPEPLQPGVVLGIDTVNCLFLGEVVYCLAERDSWQVGVEVDQALRHTNDLKRLNQSLAEVSRPSGSDKEVDVTMELSPHGPRELRFKEDR